MITFNFRRILKSYIFRYQRGDQGPDDLDNDISIIDFEQNKTISVRPPIGGPNVCRSRSRTFCCPGWHQRGSTGLCLVPICSSNRCGPTGRCIKPGLCLCDGGTIATNCGNSNAIGSNGKGTFEFNFKYILVLSMNCNFLTHECIFKRLQCPMFEWRLMPKRNLQLSSRICWRSLPRTCLQKILWKWRTMYWTKSVCLCLWIHRKTLRNWLQVCKMISVEIFQN